MGVGGGARADLLGAFVESQPQSRGKPRCTWRRRHRWRMCRRAQKPPPEILRQLGGVDVFEVRVECERCGARRVVWAAAWEAWAAGIEPERGSASVAPQGAIEP